MLPSFSFCPRTRRPRPTPQLLCQRHRSNIHCPLNITGAVVGHPRVFWNGQDTQSQPVGPSFLIFSANLAYLEVRHAILRLFGQGWFIMQMDNCNIVTTCYNSWPPESKCVVSKWSFLEKQNEAHEPECRHECWGTETILVYHIFRRTHLWDTLTWRTEVTLL